MLSFGEANLGHKEVNGKPVSAELTAAMQLAQKPIYTMPNGFNKQAMAWVNNMGNGNPNLHPVIVKNGGTVGFGTVIAINPHQRSSSCSWRSTRREPIPPAKASRSCGTYRSRPLANVRTLERTSSAAGWR